MTSARRTAAGDVGLGPVQLRQVYSDAARANNPAVEVGQRHHREAQAGDAAVGALDPAAPVARGDERTKWIERADAAEIGQDEVAGVAEQCSRRPAQRGAWADEGEQSGRVGLEGQPARDHRQVAPGRVVRLAEAACRRERVRKSAGQGDEGRRARLRLPRRRTGQRTSHAFSSLAVRPIEQQTGEQKVDRLLAVRSQSAAAGVVDSRQGSAHGPPQSP